MGFIKDVVKGVVKSLALAGVAMVGKKLMEKVNDPIDKLKDKLLQEEAPTGEQAEAAPVQEAKPVRKPRTRKAAEGVDTVIKPGKTISTIKKTAAATTPKPASTAKAKAPAKPRGPRKPKVAADAPATIEGQTAEVETKPEA